MRLVFDAHSNASYVDICVSITYLNVHNVSEWVNEWMFKYNIVFKSIATHKYIISNWDILLCLDEIKQLCRLSQLKQSYTVSNYRIACYLSSVTLDISAVATAWSLLRPSERPVLYLFQKHLLCCKCIHRQSLWTFLKRIDNAWWCVSRTLPLTSFRRHPYANSKGQVPSRLREPFIQGRSITSRKTGFPYSTAVRNWIILQAVYT